MPGYVISKTDGDEHFISAGRLAQLYGVPFHAQNVTVIREEEQGHARTIDSSHDIFLYPDPDGDYSLPE